jgi:hypothetical protein
MGSLALNPSCGPEDCCTPAAVAKAVHKSIEENQWLTAIQFAPKHLWLAAKFIIVT